MKKRYQMDNMEDRLEKIIQYSKLTQDQFAGRVGVTPGAISKAISQGTIGSKIILGLMAAFPEVNMDWFLRGEGNMFRDIKSGVDFFQELHEQYHRRDDLYNIHRLVEKVDEIEQKLKKKKK